MYFLNMLFLKYGLYLLFFLINLYPLTVQRFLKSSLSGYADSGLLPKGFHLYYIPNG